MFLEDIVMQGSLLWSPLSNQWEGTLNTPKRAYFSIWAAINACSSSFTFCGWLYFDIKGPTVIGQFKDIRRFSDNTNHCVDLNLRP